MFVLALTAALSTIKDAYIQKLQTAEERQNFLDVSSKDLKKAQDFILEQLQRFFNITLELSKEIDLDNHKSK